MRAVAILGAASFQMKSITILHLSDIHYGMVTGADGRKVSTHRFIDEGSGEPRPADLAEVVTSALRDEPALVVVSGDLGWAGVLDDYNYAYQFLEGLRTKWPGSAYVLNGGNHDVDFAGMDDACRQDALIEMLKRFYGPAFTKTFPLLDSTAPNRRDCLVGFHHVSDGFFVLSINTAASLQKVGDPVLVAPGMFKLIEDQMKSLALAPDLLRVFVLHHHLLPFAEPEWGQTYDPHVVRERADNTIVANTARLQRWLAKHSFHLALHGHKHVFHGREDVLWGNKQTERRKILVLGAASAGVSRKELGAGIENGFCILRARHVSARRWHVDVNSGEITADGVQPEFSSKSSQQVVVGEAPPGEACVFHAEDSALCHAMVARHFERPGIIKNFVSIVDCATYRHPETVRLGNAATAEVDVEKSFLALHPEFDPKTKWDDVGRMDRFFRRFGQSYRIVHGPRMFAPVRYVETSRLMKSQDELRPIFKALEALPDQPTRAYFGMYDPARDIGASGDPLPGLVGLQFVPNESAGILDLVMTFRNLELSFWWAVNVYEGCQILDWARVRVRERPPYKAGQITLCAALAEWRFDPRPMYVAQVDRMELDEMFQLIGAVDANSRSSLAVLAERLHEKAENTTPINIDYRGLELMVGLAHGCEKRASGMHAEAVLIDVRFAERLAKVVEQLRTAIENSAARAQAVLDAQGGLRTLVEDLRRRAA